MAIDIFHHGKDSNEFTVFETLNWKYELLKADAVPAGFQWLLPHGFTKFMLLELIAAVIVFLMVVPVVRRLRSGEPPRGIWANAIEGLLLFIRDEVARPAIPDKHDDHREGHDHGDHAPAVKDDRDNVEHVHRADYYLPLLWTLFLFILVCNLLGMLPFSASPTSSLMVTGVLSLITFVVIHTAGVKNNGWSGYAKSFVPKIEGDDAIMKILRPVIVVGVTAIEIMSLFIRNFVLAVRLFANMVGGHAAQFLVLLFIQMIGVAAEANTPGANLMFWPVAAGSTVLVVAMSMLELFVALLQAYVFTMLTATFIGLAVAPEH